METDIHPAITVRRIDRAAQVPGLGLLAYGFLVLLGSLPVLAAWACCRSLTCSVVGGAGIQTRLWTWLLVHISLSLLFPSIFRDFPRQKINNTHHVVAQAVRRKSVQRNRLLLCSTPAFSVSEESYSSVLADVHWLVKMEGVLVDCLPDSHGHVTAKI